MRNLTKCKMCNGKNEILPACVRFVTKWSSNYGIWVRIPNAKHQHRHRQYQKQQRGQHSRQCRQQCAGSCSNQVNPERVRCTPFWQWNEIKLRKNNNNNNENHFRENDNVRGRAIDKIHIYQKTRNKLKQFTSCSSSIGSHSHVCMRASDCVVALVWVCVFFFLSNTFYGCGNTRRHIMHVEFFFGVDSTRRHCVWCVAARAFALSLALARPLALHISRALPVLWKYQSQCLPKDNELYSENFPQPFFLLFSLLFFSCARK